MHLLTWTGQLLLTHDFVASAVGVKLPYIKNSFPSLGHLLVVIEHLVLSASKGSLPVDVLSSLTLCSTC